MNELHRMNPGLGSLPLLSDAETRSICAENPDGSAPVATWLHQPNHTKSDSAVAVGLSPVSVSPSVTATPTI